MKQKLRYWFLKNLILTIRMIFNKNFVKEETFLEKIEKDAIKDCFEEMKMYSDIIERVLSKNGFFKTTITKKSKV